MIIRILLIIITILVLSGCTTVAPIKLSPEGSQLRIVNEKNVDCCCKNKGIVTASRVYEWSTVAIENESALNEVRNKAAESGGNAIKIIEASSSGDPYHGGGITYIVGVYNCDFEKINN